MCFCNLFTLENISNLISILTPIILLLWFYYSQRSTLSEKYFKEIAGKYAGLTKPSIPSQENSGMMAGVILNIQEVYSKDYFKGELHYGETRTQMQNGVPVRQMMVTGTTSFYGEFSFKIYIDEKRNPFWPKQNRTYLGKLYVADRLDFHFEKFQIEDYVNTEYDIVHYREMQTLILTRTKVYRENGYTLPEKMILYKSAGLNFEPYRSVKTAVFIENNPNINL